MFSVSKFADWLESTGSGVNAAARLGCREVRVAMRSWKAITEDMAIQWASSFGADVDEIWGDGASAPRVRAYDPVQSPESLNQQGASSREALVSSFPVPHLPESGKIEDPKPVPVHSSGKNHHPHQSTLKLAPTRAEAEKTAPAVDTDAQMKQTSLSDSSIGSSPDRTSGYPKPCPKCGKSDFKDSAGRAGHMRWCGQTRDTEEACPYGCVEPVKGGVGNHVRWHHPDRRREPVATSPTTPCPVCLESITTKNLVRHLRTRHPDRAIPPQTRVSRESIVQAAAEKPVTAFSSGTPAIASVPAPRRFIPEMDLPLRNVDLPDPPKWARTITLASGGTVRLEVAADLTDLEQGDWDFVIGLLRQVRDYGRPRPDVTDTLS
jgi:hypothetical protein